RCLFFGETIDTCADVWKCNRLHSITRCKCKTVTICISQNLCFLFFSTSPYRSHSMNNKFCFQIRTRSNNCLARRATTLPVSYLQTFLQHPGIFRPVYGTINTATSHQAAIGCVNDCVYRQRCNISLLKLYFTHTLFFVSMIIVTGPLFTRLTFMSAPNWPV